MLPPSSPSHFSRAANSGLRCLFCCKFCFSSSSNLYSASHSPYTYCRSASLPRGRAVLFRCRTFPSRENVGKGYIIVALVMLLGCENVSPFRHGASSGSSVLTAGALMIRNSCGWEKGGVSRLSFSISNFFSRHFEGLLSSSVFGGIAVQLVFFACSLCHLRILFFLKRFVLTWSEATRNQNVLYSMFCYRKCFQ